MDATNVPRTAKRPEAVLEQQQADAIHGDVRVAAEQHVEVMCAPAAARRRGQRFNNARDLAQPQKVGIAICQRGTELVERVEEDEQRADEKRLAAAEHALDQEQRRGVLVEAEQHSIKHFEL